MTNADDATRAAQIFHAARETVAQARYCWAVTSGLEGPPSARVVEPFDCGDARWTVWFLTSASSRKAAQIDQSRRVTLGYQWDPEFAYVALIGDARIVNDRQYVADRWREAWNEFFPRGASDLDAVLVAVQIDRIEMWNPVRKIAPPPYGLRSAVIELDAQIDGWRLIAG